MSRLLAFASAVIVLLCTGCATKVEQPVEPQTFRFRFLPPDGTEFVQKVVTKRDKIFEGLGRQTERSASKTAISIRRSEAGYVMTAKPVSLKLKRNGKPVKDPLTKLLQNTVVTYRISEGGQIQSVEGYGELADQALRSLPPESARAVAQALNEDALVARETAEWNGRIGDFAGGEFTTGQSIDAEVPFTLPNGEALTYFTTISFPGFEDCEAGSCVQVEQRYDSDAAAFGRLAGEIAKGVAGEVGGEAPSVSDSRISGSASRLIDPATMLIYAETLERTIRMTVDIPGRGLVPATLKEERRYSFDYE